jgi:lipid-A-disaccharide synthase
MPFRLRVGPIDPTGVTVGDSRMPAGQNPVSGREMRIGIVAGEASGDRLGGELISALRAAVPNAQFEGMAGPQMIAAGCRAIAGIDELSVMGLVEVVRRYPALRQLRGRLVRHFVDAPPDVFIGIDVPDFNLGIERALKRRGIPTVHYVCPQVWAWRRGRAKSLFRSADLLLAVFPFEPDFFNAYGTPASFVGHPLADLLPLEPDASGARSALGIDNEGPLIAILPGSRKQEVDRLMRPFLEGAALLQRELPRAKFIVCTAHVLHLQQARRCLADIGGDLACTLVHGDARRVLTAADLAVVASGTASLEALLCRTPMIVGYRLAAFSYFIIRRMVKIPHIAIPNILAGRELVPELIQDALEPPAISRELLAWLDDADRRAEFLATSRSLHEAMRCGAARNAANAVIDLVKP